MIPRGRVGNRLPSIVGLGRWNGSRIRGVPIIDSGSGPIGVIRDSVALVYWCDRSFCDDCASVLPWICEFFSIYPRRNVEYGWFSKVMNRNECEFVELDRAWCAGMIPVEFFNF